jgi:thiol-disulfide isomerase/thioredoxin
VGGAGWAGGKAKRAALCAVLAGLAALVAFAGCGNGGKDSVDVASGGYGFVKQAAKRDFAPVGDRRAAPALSGSTVTGPRLDLASLRGKVVVVNFWASWCAPCRAETPGLVGLAKDNPNVAFVGVNEKDSPSAARAFVRDHDVPYPSLVDKIGTLAARWPTPPGLPSTFVLDREGRLAARFSGGVVVSDLAPVLQRVQAEA